MDEPARMSKASRLKGWAAQLGPAMIGIRPSRITHDIQVEIDMEQREQPVQARDYRNRRWRPLLIVLVVTLIWGAWSMGHQMGLRDGRSGQAKVAAIALTDEGTPNGVRVVIANFGDDPSVRIVITANNRVILDRTGLPGKEISAIVAPLSCGNSNPPQIQLSLVSRDGSPSDSGYLPSPAIWDRFCKQSQ